MPTRAVLPSMRAAAVPVLALVLGCVSVDNLQTRLRDATAAYNRSLRWGDIDRAAEYLPKASQMEFLARHEGMRDHVVIVDYDVTRLDLDTSTGIASSRAEVTWHTERVLVVETTSVDQLWQFHQGEFVLVDERRVSGAPLEVFAERDEDPHPYLPGLEAFRKAHEIGEENEKKRSRRRRSANTLTRR